LDRAIRDINVVGEGHVDPVRVRAVAWRPDGDVVHLHLAAPEQGHVLVGAVLQVYVLHG
jgi:hypothetical protein